MIYYTAITFVIAGRCTTWHLLALMVEAGLSIPLDDGTVHAAYKYPGSDYLGKKAMLI
ncbi:hypothetical protein MGYG_07883 [Nannizzia gypsea CBS 118893]|uniref:Uncharacterized protein n=1 Tax=Arthroderma gypseum (strain ATCC MYA-4604 / CBS 118893) TaxID=535722 RepID=E4V4F8_ARTGP|nr:hypothetical protein MGYG_07883 [Nannizzia gypsea CBS 118893]EFR04882.1 hypothetical protein MGYG_07883 [Nannizzia gypsea CBS 118893]